MKSIAAQSAAAIRSELKNAFPGIQFRVTSEIYTGGSSVNITYTDGVKSDRIKAIVSKYEMGSFDGMTDCYEYDNRDESIPQVKYVFVRRECSESAKMQIASEYGIKESEMELFNDSLREYNSAFVHRMFYEREFGQWAGIVAPGETQNEIDVMGSFDANGDVIGAASDNAPDFIIINADEHSENIDIFFDELNPNAAQLTPDQVMHAINKGWKIKLLPLYPMPERMPDVRQAVEYPNDITFDGVYSQFPGGQILRVTEVLTPSGEWHSVTNYFTEAEIEFWTVAEAIQRLIDGIDAQAFTLEIEDEHGRIKNPDFTTMELISENRSN